MNCKELGKTVLFPHIVVLCLLLPATTCFLTYAMLALEENEPVRIGAYIFATYTLTVWCARIPRIIRCFLKIKNENKYAQIWQGDTRLRMKVTLTGNFLWNGAYAILQLGLGICHRSFWFYSLAGYYFCLAFMRFFLVCHIARHKPGEKLQAELRRYRICGWVFLLMNLTVSVMIFYMIYVNRFVRHHEVTTIAMAAYTFTTLTLAIINLIRYRKYNSPAYSASKAISLAAACVSMLTLESTMLTKFSNGTMTLQRQMAFMGISGAAVSIFISIMAICMIVQSSKKIKRMEKSNGQ